jgi:hypothetical protein
MALSYRRGEAFYQALGEQTHPQRDMKHRQFSRNLVREKVQPACAIFNITLAPPAKAY